MAIAVDITAVVVHFFFYFFTNEAQTLVQVNYASYRIQSC